MPSQYLLPGELATYGLPSTITAPQITQASLLIDAYLNRPEGMVWSPDYIGLPCFMAGMVPTLTLNSSGSITAGSNVVVILSQAVPAFADMIGEVVILDRGNPSVEACVISAMTPGQITFSSVANTHSSNCTLDFGLTIFEEKSLPQERSITHTSRPPIRLLSGLGRYGYGRRTQQIQGMFNEVNLLAAIQTFGGPPMWVPFNISQCSVSLTTREIWIPAGILLSYYSDVRLRYVSGYSEAALPPIIKQATAQIINSFIQSPEMVGQLKSLGAGQIKMERFTPSQLDLDTRKMLDQYRVNITI